MNPSDLFFSQMSQMDELNRNLISNMQGGVIICQFDPEVGASKAVYLSEGWTELTGYTLQELNDRFSGNPQALVFPEDGARCNKEYVEQTGRGNRYHLEYRCRHKDGRLLWVIDRGIIIRTAEGYNQNQSIITNITPMKENEEKLRMSEARFRVAINASHATVFEFDIMTKQYLYIENAAVLFRADAQAVLAAYDAARARTPAFEMSDVFRQWYHPEDVPLLLHFYEETLQGDTGECEARVRQPDGSYIWCKLHQAVVEDEDDRPHLLVGHLTNIEEQHRRTERLLQEAQSDALTGLYNKTAIRDLVEGVLKAAPQQPHALFMLDIDNFKGVNDQLGHLFGDAVLMDVSAKLKRLFRRDGVVGRIGGDEFVALLKTEISVQEAIRRAEAICSAFRHTYSGEKKDYKISCSVGVALSTAADHFGSLYHKADVALYRAKSLGKDRYVLYQDELSKQATAYETVRVNQTDDVDSGKLKIKERIFELLYDSVDFSGSVNMILALLGQRLDAGCLYIYENTPDNQLAQPIYEWHAQEMAPCGAAQPIAVHELSYYDSFDEAGLFYCNDFSAMPPSMRALYKAKGACSTFQVAIVNENTIRGFMRYDSKNVSHPPTSEQIEIMVFAAKVTGTFIIKKRADDDVKLYNQNKMEALDNLPSAIYVIDEAYRLHYVNNMVLSIYPGVRLGQQCHEVFLHNQQPCPNCPAAACFGGPCSTEIYNPYSKMWMIANASVICWSGRSNMRLICCQVINDYKSQPEA